MYLYMSIILNTANSTINSRDTIPHLDSLSRDMRFMMLLNQHDNEQELIRAPPISLDDLIYINIYFLTRI